MCFEGIGNQRIRILASSLPIIFLIISSACVKGPHLPSRNFSTKDMLITQHELPTGWFLEDGPRFLDPGNRFYALEGASIVFVSVNSASRIATSYNVYRYQSRGEADKIFQTDFVSFATGETKFPPNGWSYPAVQADQSEIGCQSYPEGINCIWVAKYDEFIILLTSWIIPDLMSTHQLESIILTGDGIISGRLMGE